MSIKVNLDDGIDEDTALLLLREYLAKNLKSDVEILGPDHPYKFENGQEVTVGEIMSAFAVVRSTVLSPHADSETLSPPEKRTVCIDGTQFTISELMELGYTKAREMKEKDD